MISLSEIQNLSELRVGGEYRYNNFRLRGGYEFLMVTIREQILMIYM